MKFEAVLDFWFGELRNDIPAIEKQKNWFAGKPEFDFSIKKQFTTTLLAGSKGELDIWELTPRGRLAFVLVLDQFPRNIFRGTANAFLYDEKALSLARDGVEFGHDRQLKAVEKIFLYMPYQHSEKLSIQTEGLALCRKLVDEANSEAERKLCSSTLRFAEQHFKIIQHFGRFPHRNTVLGRISTPEEERFLEKGGPRFGQ